MNFPDKQRTGAVAELKVAQIFTSWSWTVGRDQIDTGYDMFVAPDVSRFRGHRFLVQVKATRQSKRRKQVAKVKRSRLRDYARAPYPVILIWVAADETVHWMHMQPWIEQNMGRLEGDGEAGIPLPKDQTLGDKDSFTEYLMTIMAPPEESAEALPKLAELRSKKLSEIDPRLKVRVGLKDGRESYEVFSTGQPIELGFQLKVKPDKEDIDGLMRAIRYGLPTTVEVDSMVLTGSQLFAAIGADGDFRGKVSIRPSDVVEGTVNFYAGNRYSIVAASCSLPARIYKGHSGFAVSNEGFDGFLAFELLADIEASGKTFVKGTFTTKAQNIAGAPIQNLNVLGVLGDWAGEVRQKNAMYIDLAFGHGRVGLVQQDLQIAKLDSIFYSLFLLGRLHKVAKAMNSDFTMQLGLVFSEDDVSDIHFVYRLLKGERVEGRVGTINFAGKAADSIGDRGTFYAETAYEVSIAGQPLGVLPIAFDLNNYVVERESDGTGFRLAPGPESSAVFYYKEDGALDATVTRTRATITEDA